MGNSANCCNNQPPAEVSAKTVIAQPSYPTKAYAIASPDLKLALKSLFLRLPRRHELLVKVEHFTVTHLDIASALQINSYPYFPGTELVGRVLDHGESVTQYPKGTVVGASLFRCYCESCAHCLSGRGEQCSEELNWRSVFNPLGCGYSSLVLVSATQCVKLDTLPPREVLPFLVSGLTVFSLLLQEGEEAKKVAVYGLGGLGSIAAAFCKYVGKEVTVVSGSMDKQRGAEELGYQFVPAEETNKHSRKFDIVIITTRDVQHEDIKACERMLCQGGLLAILSTSTRATLFELGIFSTVFKGIRLVSLLGGSRNQLQQMLELFRSQGVPKVPTIGFSFGHMEQALVYQTKRDSKRIVIQLGQ